MYAAEKRVDQTKYRGLIGSLVYLTASRPDIMFAVCLCARYQANPRSEERRVGKECRSNQIQRIDWLFAISNS